MSAEAMEAGREMVRAPVEIEFRREERAVRIPGVNARCTATATLQVQSAYDKIRYGATSWTAIEGVRIERYTRDGRTMTNQAGRGVKVRDRCNAFGKTVNATCGERAYNTYEEAVAAFEAALSSAATEAE